MTKWDLTYLFQSDEDFEICLNKTNEKIAELKLFQGKLHDEENFKKFLLLQKEAETGFSRAYQYSSLLSDLNKKNVSNLEKLSKSESVYMNLVQSLSFVDPEILSIGKEKVMSFIDHNPELEEFRFGFEKLFRNNEHVLDQKSEELLSYYVPLSDQGGSLYSSLSVGDGKSHKVRLSTKETVEINEANYRSVIADCENPRDRKKVFEVIFNEYDNKKNAYANIYNTVLMADKANAKARNYDSCLEAHLFRNNIPTSVYTNLIDVASNNNISLKKYISLRKKYLGLKEYHTYDRLLELSKANKKYTFDEAKNIFFESINKFPESFQNMAHKALEDGFVDVYPEDGKRGGAYSSSMPDLRPFILLNYTNSLDDVFTVAHEAGHSIHSLYSEESQPTTLQNYTIFVAEIASTFNEHVLLDYFMSDESIDKEIKIRLLQKSIDNIISTFYRQTLFAEYELEAHKLIENDQPINYQVLSNIMINLYQKYYGLDITKEKVKQYVWAYIPHLFYTPFYVYQYATSFAASFKIYKDVSENKEGAFDRYLGLLKAGGSKYPMQEALEAGVDFTKKETFMAVVERMDVLVDQLEQLLK
ncbi:MAG: oligoendopeptidase F [Bacilli bacterium]